MLGRTVALFRDEDGKPGMSTVGWGMFSFARLLEEGEAPQIFCCLCVHVHVRACVRAHMCVCMC